MCINVYNKVKKKFEDTTGVNRRSTDNIVAKIKKTFLGRCIVCRSSIYDFRLLVPLWYLQAFL